MKVLIVASHTTGNFSPFVMEQVESLSKLGIEFDYFGISKKGITGYLQSYRSLMQKVQQCNPDLIHAHYGLSGLLANFQRKVPVITTFHGSDIHSKGLLQLLSKICMHLSAFNIFVSKRIYEMAKYEKNNYEILPCGTDIKTFFECPQDEARKILGWEQEAKSVLFAGAFANKVKNYALAHEAVLRINGCRLIELKGYDRLTVNLLMNACDCLLMTSEREASPMVIKEAMVCGCPIVSVDVGDVKEVILGTENCFIARKEPKDIANKLSQVLACKERTDGRKRIIQLGLELSVVAQRIQAIYNDVSKRNK